MVGNLPFLTRCWTFFTVIIFCCSWAQAGSTLNFPRLSFEENTLTGFAIVNPSDQDAVVTVTVYGEDGQPLTGIANPVLVAVPANQQFSGLTSDLFGLGPDADTVAWFQATSPVDNLTGFFLFQDIPLPATLLDGADLAPSAGKIIFPQVRLGSGDTTELNIINPSGAAANLQLQLIREETLPITKVLSIPTKGVARLDVANFFEVSEAPPAAYVTVTSDVDIAGFEFVSTPVGDLVGLSARSSTEQLTDLYFPFIAVRGSFESILGVVNHSSQAVILTITAFKPDGLKFGEEDLKTNPVTRSLDPEGSLVEDLESMFGFSGDTVLDGWLQVSSTSEAVTGFISYGEPATGSAATVTPSRAGQTRAIFSHIATTQGFYTGVGVLNAGQLATTLRVLAITSSGEVLGSFSTVLQPGQRISQLISDMIPESAGQFGGLIWISSDLPVHLTSLFGSTDLKVLANVPPQPAPETYQPDAGLPAIEVNPPLAIVQPGGSQNFLVSGTGGNVIWSVNGMEGGETASGTISPGGVYLAPVEVPDPQVVTVSAAVEAQAAGASVDVLEKSNIDTSELIVQSVAYLGSLEKIYTAELAILSTVGNPFFRLSARPALETTNSEIFEIAAPGAPKISITTFGSEKISKMIAFTASTGEEFLLLAAQTSGRVIRLNPTTRELVDVATGLNEPSSLVIDPNSGDLLVAEKDQVTSIPKAQLESDLISSAQTPAGQINPQATTLFPIEAADGIAVDRCSGQVYVSDAAAGIIRRFVPLTGELEVIFPGELQQPGQLLALYRDGVGCPDSFQLLVVDGGTDRLTLLIPQQNLAAPWISARESTDLAFLPEDTPFALSKVSVLLTELLEEGQTQQTGPRYSLLAVRLPKLYRRQPPNPVLRPPVVKLLAPQLIRPTEGATIPQNDPTIGCPPDETRGFGFQLAFDWTDSSAPSGVRGYQLLVRNVRARGPFLTTFVREDSEFTLTACNSVVIDNNLTDWQWRVRAQDNLDNFSDWSRAEDFQFAPCQLDSGTSCLLQSDLSLSKSDSVDPVESRSPLTYTLMVSSAGPTTATKVTLIDRLPSRVNFVSVQSSQGECKESRGIVTCSLGVLEAGASAEVSILTVVRSSAAGTTLINSAGVEAAEDDPNELNNSAKEETTVHTDELVESDLSLTKTHSTDPVALGAPFTYTLVVTNKGPAPATKVTLADKLPSGVSFVSARSSQGRCLESRGVVNCGLGILKAGARAAVAINVQVEAEEGTILINSAVVKAAENDPDDGNNGAQEKTRVLGDAAVEADLSLSKSASPDPANAGGRLTYTMTVTNLGPATATRVELADKLPSGVSFVAVKNSQGKCFESRKTVFCALGVVEIGATAVVVILLDVDLSSAGTTLFNSAGVKGAETDPDGTNNSTQVKTAVRRAADLSLSKSAPDSVAAGASLTYTLSVRNGGPNTATGVTLTDELPSLVRFSSAKGDCTESGGAVSCAIGILASGASTTISILVEVDSLAEPGTTITTQPASRVRSLIPTSATTALTQRPPSVFPFKTRIMHNPG